MLTDLKPHPNKEKYAYLLEKKRNNQSNIEIVYILWKFGQWESTPESQSLYLNIQAGEWWDPHSTNRYYKQRGVYLRHDS